MERFPAAAAPFFVGILEYEAAFEFFFDVIHLGAEQEHDGFGVDEHGDVVFFHHLVELADLIGIFNRVGKPRAAARAHADLDARRWLAALGQQLADAGFSGVGNGDEWVHK